MKILYVSTISNSINAFMIPHIQMLIDEGHSVDIACSVQREINDSLLEQGCKVFHLDFKRSPFNNSNYKAYKDLKDLILNEKYDLVHTHTPIASAIVRLACKNIISIKVFYTAHGFHFYKGAPIKNWLIYYPMEKWLSRYTDVLITINKEDYNRAKKDFKAEKVKYIPGVGINTKQFREVIIDKLEKRTKLGIPENAFVLLSVGELNKNKNHEMIIRALAQLNNTEVCYLICGQGSLQKHLIDLVNELGLEKNVHLLGYRNDIIEICRISNLFIFPSFREGLPVSLMEAMATGLPVVCSNIRGNSDLIEDGVGGYLIKSDDIDGFSIAIQKLYEDENLRKEMGRENLKQIEKYSDITIISQLRNIYEDKSNN